MGLWLADSLFQAVFDSQELGLLTGKQLINQRLLTIQIIDPQLISISLDLQFILTFLY